MPTGNNAYRIQLLQHLEKTKSVAHRKIIEATSEPSQAKRAKTIKQVKIIQQILYLWYLLNYDGTNVCRHERLTFNVTV